MLSVSTKITKTLFIALLFSIAGKAQVKRLNLQDCVNIALERSTAVLKGNNNVATAGAQVLAAYGQYLPNLVAGGGYNYGAGNNFYYSAGPELVGANRSAYYYQLTSSLNLFTGYYNYSTWKAAKLNQQISSLTLERAKQQIELDVTQSYLQYQLDNKLVDLDSANLETSTKREEQLTMLTDVGRRARTDLYQQQAQTSSDKLLLINARSRMKNDKVVLLQKLRIDSTENYELANIAVDDNASPAQYGNRDVLISEALQNRVDYRSAQINTQYNDWLIKKFRSGYLPMVSLNAGIYNDGAYFNSLDVNGTSEMPASQDPIPTQLYKYTNGLLGLNATWNIFDRYFTRSNVAIARINEDNAQIDLQDTKIGIVADVKQAYNDYINAVQQMETVGKGLFAAQQAYDAVNARYKEGATDFITESNAQIVLLQAQQNNEQASINMMLQKKIIDFYTGRY